ncbi:PREDICTED: alpha-glucan phosphorylase, H isozyme-like [Nelumbo nucifera]|uniref:Alpha-1,4 glucan phosphorylase n=1 Tax=Nelumbo nucifera TaxID=4432 RepID=A0A1U8B096_NELNU|nr:PREDICTED: alpha-glucan phosphorylase, H isozyme-like [Nelumbo nucifera]
MLIVYVDDIATIWDDMPDIVELKVFLSSEFKIKDLGNLDTSFGLWCQDKDAYHRLVGPLLYLCLTRLDISYDASIMQLVGSVDDRHSTFGYCTVDFYDLWPQKFQYKTNGVTQRRWIVVSNPSLCALISKWLGTEAWIRDVDLLMGLREYATDVNLHQEWKMVRRVNKMRLAEYIEAMSGVKISVDAMFDVQIKRIHEYKRQLLNILGIIHRYDCIKNMEKSDRRNVVPRVCIVGGKAAPGYDIAKKIIKLCHAVAEKINNDPDIGDLLKLVFIPDYNVSVAELVIPGSDLSQHISTAGHEASGTGSMKFLMNGCLLLATADGSTVEIIEEIGEDNMFIFGAKVHEVSALREKGHADKVPLQFARVVRMVREGYFGFKDYFQSLCDTVEGDGDFFLLGDDFTSYLEAQAAADRAFVDQERWTRMSILCTAGSGRFSSDRTMEEYAEKTWDIEPCKCPI